MNELYLKKLCQSAANQLSQIYDEAVEKKIASVTTHMLIPMDLLNESTTDYNPEYKLAFDRFIQRLSKISNDDDIHINVDVSSNEGLTNIGLAMTVGKRSKLHKAVSILQNITK